MGDQSALIKYEIKKNYTVQITVYSFGQLSEIVFACAQLLALFAHGVLYAPLIIFLGDHMI